MKLDGYQLVSEALGMGRVLSKAEFPESRKVFTTAHKLMRNVGRNKTTPEEAQSVLNSLKKNPALEKEMSKMHKDKKTAKKLRTAFSSIEKHSANPKLYPNQDALQNHMYD